MRRSSSRAARRAAPARRPSSRRPSRKPCASSAISKRSPRRRPRGPRHEAGPAARPMSAVSQGFDVFDCHHHVGEASGFMGGLAGRAPEAAETELEARLAIMDRGGVRQAAVLPGHGYERPQGVADTQRANDRIAEYRDRRPDRFPVAIGIVEPLHSSHSLAEIERCARELSLVGLSFHARFQGVSMDDARIRHYVERMGESWTSCRCSTR
ncbi:MAG: hypothetical protein E4H11_08380 [Myxococcales bacterium]|nr:MAG: hypothetical protein E4H11_08380 [Myxococcales bacterium]